MERVRGRWRWCGLGGAVLLTALGLAGCDEPPPAAPSPPLLAIQGTWSGAMIDRQAGSGQVQLIASGVDPNAFGTFSVAFVAPVATAGGQIIGRTQDIPTIYLTFVIESASRDCPGTPGILYQARLALSGNRLTGNYEPLLGCALLTGGSLELTRR